MNPTDRDHLAKFASVRNGTAQLSLRRNNESMLHKKSKRHKKAKKTKRELNDSTRASVKKEMAKPRMSKSARIAERNLDTSRIPEEPSTILAGSVDEIIPSRHPSHPEQAQIAVDGASHRHRELRIENSLSDEHGDEVKLKKGAHVEVTIAAEGKTSTAKIMKQS